MSVESAWENIDPAYPNTSRTDNQTILDERALVRDVISWLADGFVVSDLLNFSTQQRDIKQSYLFCTGVHNDGDPTHSAIVLSGHFTPSDLSSQMS